MICTLCVTSVPSSTQPKSSIEVLRDTIGPVGDRRRWSNHVWYVSRCLESSYCRAMYCTYAGAWHFEQVFTYCPMTGKTEVVHTYAVHCEWGEADRDFQHWMWGDLPLMHLTAVYRLHERGSSQPGQTECCANLMEKESDSEREISD